MHKSRLPITLKRKNLSKSPSDPSKAAPAISSNSSEASPRRKNEGDPPLKMYSLDRDRLRAIEALTEENPPSSSRPQYPSSLRRLIISDDEDEDVRILMERTQELLKSSKKKKKKKSTDSPARELVQSSCESDQGIGSMPSSIISVSGHVSNNPLPEEKEEPHLQELCCIEDPVDDSSYHARIEDPRRAPPKKGLATQRSELLSEKPIKPNIHVGSKLKAMLEGGSAPKGGRKTGRATPRKTGKWDAIMKNINANAKASEKRTYKEVKSKVFDEIGGSSSPRAKAPKPGSKTTGGNSGRSSSRASIASTGRQEVYSSEPTRDKSKETVRRIANGNCLENQKKSSSPLGVLPPAALKLSAARKSKDRRLSIGRIGSPGISQTPSNPPDLVKSSTRSVEDNAKYSGLEAEIDARNRQVEELRRRLSQANKGFDVMALLYQRALSKVNPGVRNKDLKSQIQGLQNKLISKDQEIDDLKKEERKLKAELESGLAKIKTEKSGVTEDYNRRLSQIKTQHATLLEKVERNYRDDLEELTANHSRILLETQEAAEAKLQHVLEENESQWKTRILEELAQKEESLKQIQDDSGLKEKEWEGQREALSQRINDLIRQIESQAPSASPRSSSPLNIIPSTSPKEVSKENSSSVIFNLSAEVESLKAVVDMRTADVHQLRKDNVALEEKLAEFDKMKLDHAKTLALLEDLRAQIESKSMLERKLSEENRHLLTSVERELGEKKRLSMENEELQWKIRHEQSSLSGADNSLPHNQTMSFMEGVSSSPRSVLFDYDEDEAAKLSYSFTEGISESPFKPKSGLSRSMSLKERKMGVVSARRGGARRTSSIDIMSTSLPPPRHGRSAFVREVIDKGDSVSWKIEYEDKSALAIISSPIPQRRPVTNRRKVGVTSLLYNEPLSESSESSSASSTTTTTSSSSSSRRTEGPPASVDIVKDSLVLLNADELSSSSEIEIDEKQRSPEEETIRHESMTTSLPSYDLHLLFANHMACKESGGESLMILEEEEDPATANQEDNTKTEKTMTDSLSAVSWSDDFEE